jgi:hypothetical protein
MREETKPAPMPITVQSVVEEPYKTIETGTSERKN